MVPIRQYETASSPLVTCSGMVKEVLLERSTAECSVPLSKLIRTTTSVGTAASPSTLKVAPCNALPSIEYDLVSIRALGTRRLEPGPNGLKNSGITGVIASTCSPSVGTFQVTSTQPPSCSVTSNK